MNLPTPYYELQHFDVDYHHILQIQSIIYRIQPSHSIAHFKHILLDHLDAADNDIMIVNFIHTWYYCASMAQMGIHATIRSVFWQSIPTYTTRAEVIAQITKVNVVEVIFLSNACRIVLL